MHIQPLGFWDKNEHTTRTHTPLKHHIYVINTAHFQFSLVGFFNLHYATYLSLSLITILASGVTATALTFQC